MTDIFREVDEEIRKERYADLFRKYGPWVGGLALLLVLAVAGYQGWEAYQRDQALAASDTYATAVRQLEDGARGEALDRLRGIGSVADGGYGLLAGFRRAEALAAAGDTAAAAELWERIAESAPSRLFRDLATLSLVMHRFEAADPGELDGRLEPLAAPDGPFRFTAMELQALLAQRGGDRERAISLYKDLADSPNVPLAQRQRAAEVLAQLEG